MKHILVTGASGFIGKDLCKRLLGVDWYVRGAVRSGKSSELPDGVAATELNSIDGETDWSGALDGIDHVAHLAARVHVMQDSAACPMAEYRHVNVKGTERLAYCAAENGVKRFIFMSTVKVNGEENIKPYNEKDPPSPRDSYGISKLQAEERLRIIADKSGMELVILRPPLVYGPGVKANFLQLLKIVNKRLPLPLAGIHNRRSFIYLGNLVDAVLTCLKHADSIGDTYLVSDDHDVSTPDLIKMTAAALHKPARLFPFPQLLLYTIARLTGRGSAVDRLIGSLTVDISKIKNELDWHPPYKMEHGIKKTADWYRQSVHL